VLLPLVAAALRERTCDEWMAILVGAAIPCGPVNDMQHVFSDPQVRHRGMAAEVAHPTIGTLGLAGIPIKYSATPGAIRLPPPLLASTPTRSCSRCCATARRRPARCARRA